MGRINPPKRVAESIKQKLSKTLAKMCKEGVIEEVERPRGWSSNINIVEKPDKALRICLDPVELNKVIIRDLFLIPTLEEVKK